MTKNVDFYEQHKNLSLNTTNDEEWIELSSINRGYFISNLGRVKSLRRLSPAILTQQYDKRGYLRVQVQTKHRRPEMFLVHRLVAMAFIPNPESKKQVNHKDGIKTNNNVSNLEWVSNQENIIHAFENGLMNPEKGEDRYCAKLTEEKVVQARMMRIDGASLINIANTIKVNASLTAISNAITGKRWSHVHPSLAELAIKKQNV